MGYQFEVVVANVEEMRAVAESPVQYVERLSRDKALAGAALVDVDAVVIGSDTIVVKDQEVL
ncbi:MAG: Maf family protein, partial [Vibrio sp.]